MFVIGSDNDSSIIFHIITKVSKKILLHLNFYLIIDKLAITPMISSLSLMDNAESESEVLGIGLSVIMLNIGMYLGVPAVVIVGIRKRI
jgi:hypothetical protein